MSEHEREKKKYGVIVIDKDGFKVTGKGHSAHIQWAKLNRVDGYQIDLFADDMVACAFYAEDNEQPVETHECMVGFRDLLGEIEERLGAKLADWWFEITRTPFEPNLMTVWKREGSA